MLFAAKHKDKIKALVLWNALIDYHSLLNPELPWSKKYFSDADKKIEKNGFVEIGSRKFRIGKPLFKEMKKLHPWKELKKLEIPVLFVHGDKDTHVPYEDSVKYSGLLKNAQLKTIHEAGHGFHDNKKQEEQADNATIEFFRKNMKSTSKKLA